jgi:formiminotetrahydrofolate cyclodeaminase
MSSCSQMTPVAAVMLMLSERHPTPGGGAAAGSW